MCQFTGVGCARLDKDHVAEGIAVVADQWKIHVGEVACGQQILRPVNYPQEVRRIVHVNEPDIVTVFGKFGPAEQSSYNESCHIRWVPERREPRK